MIIIIIIIIISYRITAVVELTRSQLFKALLQCNLPAPLQNC
jgi:hypothetical protein